MRKNTYHYLCMIALCTACNSPDTYEAETIRRSTHSILRIDSIPRQVNFDFHKIHAVEFVDTSLIAVSHGSLNEILLFDITGELRTTRGRDGDGPGEMRSISRPWVTEDNKIAMYDESLRRASYFDIESDEVETLSTDATSLIDKDYILWKSFGILSDGSVLLWLDKIAAKQTGLSRSTMQLALLHRTGTLNNIGDEREGLERSILPPDDTGEWNSFLVSPFAFEPLASPCGNEIILSDNSSYKISSIDLSGKERIIINENISPAAATDSAFRSLFSQQIQQQSQIPEGVIETMKRVTPSGVQPVLKSIYCDSDENVWIEEYAVATDRRLSSYSSQGELRFSLVLPAHTKFLGAHKERIAISVIDDMGAESLEILQIDDVI